MKDKRVVLLTGSTGRLGKVFVEKYNKDYIIVGVSRHGEPTDHDFVTADVRREVDDTVKYVLDNYGKIDLLINNAATYKIKPLVEFTRMEFNQQFNVNVVSPLILATSIIKQFWKGKTEKNKKYNRNIINISSISATEVFAGQGTYAPTKSALNMLTLHMSEEFKEYGVRVNAVSPTRFPSDMLSPEEVADAVVATDRSNDNGRIKVLDGQTIAYLF